MIMLALQIPLRKAEQVKQELRKKKRLDTQYLPQKQDGFLLLPVIRPFPTRFSLVRVRGQKVRKQDKKEELKKMLTPKERERVKRSFDMVGNIAILEIPHDLVKKQHAIAKVFLKHNNITTVLKKKAGHTGTYRTQPMVWLAGKKTTKTLHKENGVVLEVDVAKVYFSVRLSEERKRIALRITKGERVLVMFSGCAPYPIVFSKNTPAAEVYGIEINPVGHRLGLANVKRNKATNVTLYCGDVRKVVPKIGLSFDRIVMPLPKQANHFLDLALTHAGPGAWIHLYSFQHKDHLNKIRQMVRQACKKHQRACTISQVRKVGQQSPHTYRVCADIHLE